MSLGVVPLLFAVRFVLSTTSYGTGAAGGIFAPLLALGALLGLGIGAVAHMFFPGAVPVPAVSPSSAWRHTSRLSSARRSRGSSSSLR